MRGSGTPGTSVENPLVRELSVAVGSPCQHVRCSTSCLSTFSCSPASPDSSGFLQVRCEFGQIEIVHQWLFIAGGSKVGPPRVDIYVVLRTVSLRFQNRSSHSAPSAMKCQPSAALVAPASLPGGQVHRTPFTSRPSPSAAELLQAQAGYFRRLCCCQRHDQAA